MTEPVDPQVEAALRMRASDADRERVAALLREAYVEGRLSPVEHDERLSAVYQATTYADLVPVLHDLPVPRGTLAVPAGNDPVSLVGHPAPASGGVVVDPSRAAQAEGNAVAIFGGFERRGRWVVPDRLNATCVFGGGEIDFTEAVLTSREVEIQAVCVFGGMSITVPEGMAVRIEAAAVFGGSTGPKTEAPPGSPLLRISGVVFFGGVDVKRAEPPRGKGP